jgi:hypothetical protein
MGGLGCVGQKCATCALAKIVFKNARWEKNKKHWVGLSVGLLAVQLQYGLYVFSQLSKWFALVLCLSFGRSVVMGAIAICSQSADVKINL